MRSVSRRLLAPALANLLLLASSLAWAEPQAVLMSVSGHVEIVADDGSVRPGTFGMHLESGDTVQTAADGSAEIYFSAGNWIQVDGGSKMVIRGRPSSGGSGSTPAPTEAPGGGGGFESAQKFLTLKDAKGTSTLASLRSGQEQPELDLVSPRQTRVRIPRPTFRWTADDPSLEVQLTVYAPEGVHWQTTAVDVTELAYPDHAPPLQAETSYSWTLETTDPLLYPPLRTGSAFFEVLAADDSATLEAALTRVQSSDAPSWGQHFLTASTLYEYGLVEEAATKLEEALANEGDQPQLRAILARLYSDLGRTREALSEYEALLND